MKTSCFKYYTGDMGMSICLYPPIDYIGAQFRALAPTSNMFYEIKNKKITEEEYAFKYKTLILAEKNPQEIYSILKNNVLLCWENPGEFCHRRLVAQWIEEALGVEVPEWNKQDEKSEKLSKDKKIKPLF